MGLAKITGTMGSGFQESAGQVLMDEWGTTKTTIGGFVDALEEDSEVEIIPTVMYVFGAGPTIERGASALMKQVILDSLKMVLPLDAVALATHGAGIADGVDDVEAELTVAIRQLVGSQVKLVAALEHHANLTDRFLQ